MRYAVIMAGGSGTRLWPLSRQARPKQLLELVDGQSLLQLAYHRLVGAVPAEHIFVCASAEYRDAVRAHLPQLPADNVLGEPVGRDTANAIGFSSAVLQQRDADAVIAFVSSDHVIEPVAAFQAALAAAFELAEQPGRLVTFGIPPTSPHTGLGYIKRGEPIAGTESFEVAAFAEKPDAATARDYVDSGEYLWNSGMFVWRAATVLAQLARTLPTAEAGAQRIAAAWDTAERESVLAEVYPTLPKISIDYAVMEPAAREPGTVAVVPMPIRWQDIGSFPALATTLPTDDRGNASRGETLLLDSTDTIVVSPDADHLIAAVGVSDLVVVHTSDVTMICPRDDAERVKKLAAEVAERYGPRFS